MIRFTVEYLYHFSCGKCGKWWSVGDFQPSQYTLTCPFCKHEGSLEQMPMPNEHTS